MSATHLTDTAGQLDGLTNHLAEAGNRLNWACGSCGVSQSASRDDAAELIDAGWTPHAAATSGWWACPDCAQALSTESF